MGHLGELLAIAAIVKLEADPISIRKHMNRVLTNSWISSNYSSSSLGLAGFFGVPSPATGSPDGCCVGSS